MRSRGVDESGEVARRFARSVMVRAPVPARGLPYACCFPMRVAPPRVVFSGSARTRSGRCGAHGRRCERQRSCVSVRVLRRGGKNARAAGVSRRSRTAPCVRRPQSADWARTGRIGGGLGSSPVEPARVLASCGGRDRTHEFQRFAGGLAGILGLVRGQVGDDAAEPTADTGTARSTERMCRHSRSRTAGPGQNRANLTWLGKVMEACPPRIGPGTEAASRTGAGTASGTGPVTDSASGRETGPGINSPR